MSVNPLVMPATLLTRHAYPLGATVVGDEPTSLTVSVRVGRLELDHRVNPATLGAKLDESGRELTSTRALTQSEAQKLLDTLRYVSPEDPTAKETLQVKLGGAVEQLSPRFTLGVASDCASLTLVRHDDWRSGQTDKKDTPTAQPQPEFRRQRVHRTLKYETLEVQTIVRKGDDGHRCPTGPYEVRLALTRAPDTDVLACPSDACVSSTVRVEASDQDQPGPALRFVDAARQLGAEEVDPMGGAANEYGASIRTATLYASLVVTLQGESSGASQVLVSARPLTARKLPSAMLPTAGFVTHPGAFSLTLMRCSDILGSAAKAPGAAFGEFEQRCFESPGTITAVDSITVAPIGVHIRWNPTPRTPWFGIGADLSALALGTSGNLTDETTDDDHTGLWSPGLFMTGVDLELGRADVEVTRLNVLLGGGLAAVQADGSFRPRPFFGLTVMVPIATLDPNKSAKSSPTGGD